MEYADCNLKDIQKNLTYNQKKNILDNWLQD